MLVELIACRARDIVDEFAEILQECNGQRLLEEPLLEISSNVALKSGQFSHTLAHLLSTIVLSTLEFLVDYMRRVVSFTAIAIRFVRLYFITVLSAVRASWLSRK